MCSVRSNFGAWDGSKAADNRHGSSWPIKHEEADNAITVESKSKQYEQQELSQLNIFISTSEKFTKHDQIHSSGVVFT